MARPFVALADTNSLVVKRTFIEFHDGEEQDAALPCGLGRRVSSDPGPLDRMDFADGDGQADFELTGFSDTETAPEEGERAPLPCYGHVGERLLETASGTATAAPSEHGSEAREPAADQAQEPQPGPLGEVLGGFEEVPQAVRCSLDSLLAENRRLAGENWLLRLSALRLEHKMLVAPQNWMPGSLTVEEEENHGVGDLFTAPEWAPGGGRAAPGRSTVMLRNLPNNYSRAMVLAMIDDEGFFGLYDFLYLPIDFKSSACLGYCFVNLTDAGTAAELWRVFDGFSRWILPSKKVCSVCWSGPHQGLAEHVERYRNSPVMHPSVPDEYKPVVLAGGARVAFPPPTKAPRAPRMRHHRDKF